jgi:A/G-specific adenine glycosylase
MLQQTQVERVLPKYRAFLKRFPTLRALADAPLADVLRLWSGLGYNGRARRLWTCARIVRRDHAGRLPRDVDTLAGLPGIGRYTAAAIASFAFGERVAVVDTNVRRVLGRAIDGADAIEVKRAWHLAALALPKGRAGDWNQALMDVGALFCRRAPRCEACPARNTCRAGGKLVRPARSQATNVRSPYAGSRRFYRGRIVKALAQTPSLSFLKLGGQVKEGFGETDVPWLEDLLAGLQRDGLVAVDRGRRRVRLP